MAYGDSNEHEGLCPLERPGPALQFVQELRRGENPDATRESDMPVNLP